MLSNCLHCGEDLDPEGLFSRLYCRKECGRAYRAPAIATGRTCAYTQCGKPLDGRRSNVIFCGPPCCDRDRRERQRLARPKGWKPRPCGGHPGPRPGARRYRPGDTFGELTLVEYTASDKSGSRADFRCTCGATTNLAVRNVVSLATTRCRTHRTIRSD